MSYLSRVRHGGEPRYFILYELADENEVGGADYLARLNAPTAWSQRIMPRLGNFARGGGRVDASAGLGQGGIVAPLRLDAAHTAKTSIKTSEKGMRSNEGSFTALVLIEGLDEAALRTALHHLRAKLPADDQTAIAALPLYRFAFSLTKQELI